MSRLDAARRVLLHYHWVCARLTRRGIDLDLPGGPGRIGRIDRLRVRRGITRIEGWTTAPRLRFLTERATAEAGLVPDPAHPDRRRFDLSVEGASQLAFAVGAMDAPAALPLYGALRHAANAVWTLLSLIPFPFVNARDLVAYLARGDSQAGNRLERALLPLVGNAARPPVLPARLVGDSPLPPAPAPVDIVIPVFNAPGVLAECLDRVARHSDLPHRVVVLDDASTDPAVGPILDAFAARHPQAMVLRHDQNMGFVASVNRALAETRGHVVLLNSDAMVPEGWLSRLMAPIHADPGVASVTPMSSDAEIFSAPVECVASRLPAGAVDRIDRAARRLDWTVAQAKVPTGVGFCMAMSRQWLDRVPGFDPIFGRGYGEEVDWCRKVANLGGVHQGLGSLFVEHRSGSSFGAEKAARIAANNRIVSGRYPAYDQLVADFRRTDPLIGPRLALAMVWAAEAGAVRGPLPVYLAHKLGGGAEHWLQSDIARRMGEGAGGALVIRDAGDGGLLLAEVHSPHGITRALCALPDLLALLALLPAREVVYSCLVSAEDPLGMMTAMLGALGPDDRLSVLFHDFLPLCPSYNLIGTDGAFCGLPGPEACQSCYRTLAATSGKRPPQIADWRAGWKRVLDRADVIRCFSRDSAGHVARVWPDLAGRIEVAPHRLDTVPERVIRSPGPRLTVGVLGGIGYAKGAHILRDLANRTNDRFRIVVIGKLDPAFANPRLVVHGPYDRAEIADLARQYEVDLWFLPSIWPETFSYAVHECIATGLPVLGFDLGAQGEALRTAPNGRVLPVGTPVDPALLARLASQS